MKKIGKIMYIGTSIIVPAIIIYFTNICDGFKDNTAIFVFFIITFVMYLLGLILIFPVLGIREELIEVVNKYSEIENFENLDSQKRYNKLVGIIENNDKLKFINKLFDEFQKTLKGVKQEVNESGEEVIKYYSTTDIEYFFEEDNLVYKNIYNRTITQITQGLTGVGIFGTFLGIVQGVSNLNLDDSDAMKIGIATLLKGVKVSFNSSLYGIMFSVILVFLLKIVVDITMKKAYEFCGKVTELISPYTEQSALMDLEIELKKQTSTFEQLATNIAEEMGKKFDQSMQNNLEKLADNLGEVIKEIQEKLSNSISDNTAQTIVGLTSTMQPIMIKLEAAMSNLEQNQQESTGKFMSESIQSIKDAISIGTTDEVTRLRESMDVISDRNSELLETFTSSMENMKQLTLYQENLVKNTTNSTESINVTTDNIKELQQDLSKVIIGLKDVGNVNNVSLENIQNTVESLKDSMTKQLGINSSLESMINKTNKLGEVQDSYISKFERLSQNMNNNVSYVENYMNNINSGISSYKDYFENIKNSTLEIASTLDLKYKNITNDLDNANKGLVSTVDSIQNNIIFRIDETGDKLNDVVKGLDDFQNKAYYLTDKIEKFADVEESTQILWKNYKSSFEELNSQINEGVVNYTKSISEGVNTLFSEYDTNISNAVTSLKNMVEVLNDSVEAISESFEAIEKHNNSNKEAI